jgi:acetyltransferase-like isoleucine patch superfamily enzyme
MNTIRVLIQLLLFPFPWPVRRIALQALFGYQIHKGARIGLSFILAKRLSMADKARILSFVFCKDIDALVIGYNSSISRLTFITGYPSSCKPFFSAHDTQRRCELVLGDYVGVTSRHYLDCNGGIYIGDFTTIAGLRSQILTHSINIYTNHQETKPVHIGRYCFVGTGCIILPGAAIPDFCLLAAGAVLTKAMEKPYTLYAGNPATARKQLVATAVPYFSRNSAHVY